MSEIPIETKSFFSTTSSLEISSIDDEAPEMPACKACGHFGARHVDIYCRN